MAEAALETVSGQGRVAVEERRRRILDAACACVRREGFHGASMAEIARAADLSVGQIYRYFDNKEAIIAAIADRDLAEMREKFAELEADGDQVAEVVVGKCAESLEKNYEPERAALMLEVLAEAARNPKVAAIVQRADADERAMAQRFLEQAGLGALSERERAARGELLSMIFDGMVTRAINNPGGDKAAISEVLKPILARLFSPEPLAEPPT